MSELKTRVEELKMENEYQLRLKDMNYNEKIKDLTDKFLQEIEGVKAKNEVRVHGYWYMQYMTCTCVQWALLVFTDTESRKRERIIST